MMIVKGIMENTSEDYGSYITDLENNQNLNVLFKDLSGYYYNYQKQVLKKDTSITPRYCKLIVNRLMGYTIGALTEITRMSKNPHQVIAFKSTGAFADLWKIFYDFRHKCKINNTKDEGKHCIRSKDGSFFIIDINKLAKVIDDSYRWSLDGFTSDAKNKQHTVNENIEHVKEQKKKSYLNIGNKIKIPVPGRESEEEED